MGFSKPLLCHIRVEYRYLKVKRRFVKIFFLRQ